MKKILLLFFVISSTICTNAQSSKREEGIKLGIKGGLNVSNLAGDVKNNEIRTSIHIGFLSEFIVSDKFSIQPEILYSGQGYIYKDENTTEKNKLNYITLPVLAKYYILNNVSIETGPQIGALIYSRSKTNEGSSKIDNQSIVDFGLNIGMGYELKSGVFFQTRYNHGLTNINNSDSSNKTKYTNSVFQLSVGIQF